MDYAKSIELYPLALTFSPVKGPEGNIEYLLYLSKDRAVQNMSKGVDAEDAWQVVEASHDTLDKEGQI